MNERGVARLTLQRPEARNAIPVSGWEMLAERLGEVEQSDAHLLVVSGDGAAFCAGADLADFIELNEDEAACAGFREAMRAALDRLRDLEIPTIAEIQGPCYGAGVALAIACDLRIASSGARFAITPALLGISYPQEDVHRLVELVGTGQAARLLFTGLVIDGAEASRIGLVELCEPEGGIEPILETMLGNSSKSLCVLKRAVRLAAQGARTDREQDRLFDALIGSDDMKARLEALRRK